MSSSDDGGLRPLFRQALPQMQWTTVETGAVSPGVPDSEWCAAGGISGWVEFKQTEGWAVTLRPEQVSWISRRARLGGRVVIAVRRWHSGGPRRGPAVDELWLLDGARAALWRERGLRAAEPLLLTCGGPSRWDWGLVRRLLVA